MNELPGLKNAWLAVSEGKIEDYGSMDSFDASRFSTYESIDCTGQMVLPTWVDSHTHLVFAEWRNQEFEDRINGLSYHEIAERGGGILNSANKMATADEDVLFEEALQRLQDAIRQGTGAIEIKSGYGLTVEAELKMLRIVKRLQEASPIPVKATFLGAHAFPLAYSDKKEEYVDLIINEMIPAVASQNLATYIDAFCEEGYFSVDQTERILEAGAKYGLKPKVHVNQFNVIGGVEVSTKYNAISVDHLEELNNDDIEALKSSQTIPVALPSCSFFLSIPYTPARELMNADLPLALATDFNPGSTPSSNMNFVLSLACIKMKMTPQEAINAMTLNAAAALELSDEVGSITKGKRANIMVMKPVPAISFLPYSFGNSHIDKVYINGEEI